MKASEARKISMQNVNTEVVTKMNEIFKHFGVERTTFKTVEKTTEASNNVDNSAAGKIDNDLLDFEF